MSAASVSMLQLHSSTENTNPSADRLKSYFFEFCSKCNFLNEYLEEIWQEIAFGMGSSIEIIWSKRHKNSEMRIFVHTLARTHFVVVSFPLSFVFCFYLCFVFRLFVIQIYQNFNFCLWVFCLHLFFICIASLCFVCSVLLLQRFVFCIGKVHIFSVLLLFRLTNKCP